MIDYFFHFSSEAVAIADASGTIYHRPADVPNNIPAMWNPDRVTPGLQIWRNSLDTSGGLDSFGNNIVVHHYLTGWYGCVSLDHQDATLLAHAGLQLAIDRDLSAAGQVAIIKSNVGVALQDLRFSPVFAGSNYPFGALI